MPLRETRMRRGVTRTAVALRDPPLLTALPPEPLPAPRARRPAATVRCRRPRERTPSAGPRRRASRYSSMTPGRRPGASSRRRRRTPRRRPPGRHQHRRGAAQSDRLTRRRLDLSAGRRRHECRRSHGVRRGARAAQAGLERVRLDLHVGIGDVALGVGRRSRGHSGWAPARVTAGPLAVFGAAREHRLVLGHKRGLLGLDLALGALQPLPARDRIGQLGGQLVAARIAKLLVLGGVGSLQPRPGSARPPGGSSRRSGWPTGPRWRRAWCRPRRPSRPAPSRPWRRSPAPARTTPQAATRWRLRNRLMVV